MGKMKELMIERQNDLETKLEELEDNTKELNEMTFDDDLSLTNVKEVVNEALRILKELKEIILI